MKRLELTLIATLTAVLGCYSSDTGSTAEGSPPEPTETTPTPSVDAGTKLVIDPAPGGDCPTDVRYVSHDPLECAALLYRCSVDERSFEGECGCGCAPLYDCDPNHVACRALPPDCDDGLVASVEGACWGSCVPEGQCAPAEPECHDAASGARYVGTSAAECAVIRFTCDAGEEYFADDCGCGCLPIPPPEGCEGDDRPGRRYFGSSPTECAALDFICELDQQYFFNDCGCGCEPMTHGMCLGDDDPSRRYIGDSLEDCARITYICGENEIGFSNDCGCGCEGLVACYNEVACDSVPPECPAGQVPSTPGACWGPCVREARCIPLEDSP